MGGSAGLGAGRGLGRLRLGLDVGSTTVKAALVDEGGELAGRRYIRHHADIAGACTSVLEAMREVAGGAEVRMAVCGSGGRPVAQALGVGYVQEVVASTVAVGRLFPQARTLIELGGQDAKVVFFDAEGSCGGGLQASDMRMNGSCAGGTGAFIDEVAKLLDAGEGGLEELAARGKRVYEVSGRCGVFAKTDIQPLLIQGVPREDLALSALHAIAKQTIGGLAQGLELRPPVVFAGGTLTHCPTLVRVFKERLDLADDEAILPADAEVFVALGCALSIGKVGRGRASDPVDLDEACGGLAGRLAQEIGVDRQGRQCPPLFATPLERERFEARHEGSLGKAAFDHAGEAGGADMPRAGAGVAVRAGMGDGVGEGMGDAADRRVGVGAGTSSTGSPASLSPIDVYLGVDSGSTTSKVALLDEAGAVLALRYAHNDGDPVGAVKRELLSVEEQARSLGFELHVLGLGTTGYGERMLASALGADASTVETVAHARGCTQFVPDATFILDIGGQDMKAIWLHDGTVTNVMLNEACSSGCGSFLENFADTLGVPVEDIARVAFSSEAPAKLGSRCTVFMTSSVINEQRNGKREADIMAGLCRSIVENVFTKVVRVADFDELGDRVVVQGGTFRNLVVLRALEEYLGREVTRAPFPGEMGAVGAALYVRDAMTGGRRAGSGGAGTASVPADETRGIEGPAAAPCRPPVSEPAPDRLRSSFIGFEALRALSWKTSNGLVCTGCANSCARTVTAFSTGGRFVTGNRCPRGEELGVSVGAARTAPASARTRPAKDLFELRGRLLFGDYPCTPVRDPQPQRIGVPRVLEFWDSMPFWRTFLGALGHEVVLSRPTRQKSYEAGLRFVASDTACLPAKAVHGHILDLCEQGVDRILFPHVMHMPPEGTDKTSPYTCAMVMGYPMVVRNFQDPQRSFGVAFDTPVFHWFSEKNRRDQVCAWARETLGATRRQAKEAFEQGEQAILAFRRNLAQAGQEVLGEVRGRGGRAVVLAGRPYHCDPFVSHGISRMFAQAGIPVLTADSLPHQHEVPLENLLPEVTNDFHTRMLESALIAANDPVLEYAQVVSFGCGHDAILSDEVTRILQTVGGKCPLVLKVDESDAQGSIAIRVRSFIETMGR